MSAFLLVAVCSLGLSTLSAAPVPLIIDTDLGFDVDDVGAVAVGNHLHDIGAANLLGVVHNTGFLFGIGGRLFSLIIHIPPPFYYSRYAPNYSQCHYV